jgi:hypothetical protein
MKKTLLVGAALVLAVAALPAIATGATITFSRSTSVTGNLSAGTSAIFTDTGNLLTISCTTHTIRATVRNASNSTRSTNTSVRILSTENVYSQTGQASCPYTLLGLSGLVGVRVRCDWLLTAIDTRTGTVTITADRCVELTFTTGPIAACSIFVDRQSVTVGVTSSANPTQIDVVANRASLTSTNNARTCGGLPNPSAARQTETIAIPTAGLSTTG